MLTLFLLSHRFVLALGNFLRNDLPLDICSKLWGHDEFAYCCSFLSLWSIFPWRSYLFLCLCCWSYIATMNMFQFVLVTVFVTLCLLFLWKSCWSADFVACLLQPSVVVSRQVESLASPRVSLPATRIWVASRWIFCWLPLVFSDLGLPV